MNTKSIRIIQDPRSESFFEMLKFSICPLLKKNSFTYWICILDVFLYIFSVGVQFLYSYNLRPQQKTLFYLGQLYPIYAQREVWRLVMSLEQHRNEFHLLLSIVLKLHFYSFVEHILGRKQIAILYLISGMSATIFQSIMSAAAGVCGSFHVGIILLGCYLQGQMLLQCSPQQQLQFYFDYQQSQNGIHNICKVFIPLLIILMMSIRDQGILFLGTMVFMLQSFLLGKYFQQNTIQQQTLQLINSTQQKQFNQYFLLSGVISLLLAEMIIFWNFKTMKPI